MNCTCLSSLDNFRLLELQKAQNTGKILEACNRPNWNTQIKNKFKIEVELAASWFDHIPKLKFGLMLLPATHMP